jgi:CelD/BcsL family acetyltransferase involved in cellulose biosynthesis
VNGELDSAQWLAFDRMHPAPTFFARPAWALALGDAVAHLRPVALWTIVDGERYVIPTVRTRGRMPFREHLAFPLGGYTCVLDSHGRPAGAKIAGKAIASLAASVDALTIIPWPLAPAPVVNAAPTATYETAAIDCSGGFERVLARVRGVTRRMAGQAERRGVVCERAPAHELGAYYELLSDASRAWGLARPTISRELLEAVFARGDGDVQLWFARVDGVIAGGGVILYGTDELFFWSAAMRREYGRYRPSNALNLCLIAQACARGVRWYNLGASEGLDGVARFKHDLGANAIAYQEWRFSAARFGFYHRARAHLTVRTGV